MTNVVLFEDDDTRLAPLTDLRSSFDLRTGALTTLERWVATDAAHKIHILPSPQHTALAAEKHSDRIGLPNGDMLLINGRWTAVDHPLPDQPDHALVDNTGTLLAACVSRDRAEQLLTQSFSPEGLTSHVIQTDRLLRRPWDLLRIFSDNLDRDLAAMADHPPLEPDPTYSITLVGRHPVRVGRRVTVHPHVVFDTSAGPIVIDDDAEVRSMSVIVGPSYIGKGSAVVNHAHLRGHTAIGPMCKVGGEVNASVFQGYANKAHGGYLGNSYVGEWVNLGAGTNTSNLKNTYGEVRMQTTDAPAESTGMTHLGSILGDHVKTAIGTRLGTGTCVHTGAMLAASTFPPKRVKRFAFLTDQGNVQYDLEKFISVADIVMERRQQAVTPALRTRLAELHSDQA